MNTHVANTCLLSSPASSSSSPSLIYIGGLQLVADERWCHTGEHPRREHLPPLLDCLLSSPSLIYIGGLQLVADERWCHAGEHPRREHLPPLLAQPYIHRETAAGSRRTLVPTLRTPTSRTPASSPRPALFIVSLCGVECN